MLLLMVAFLVCFSNVTGQQTGTIDSGGGFTVANKSGYEQKNVTVNNPRVPLADALGGLVYFVDFALTRIGRGRSVAPPRDDLCAPFLLNFASYEMKFSRQPRGRCSYCCPLTNPARHIRLYFTNTANPGVTLQLKLIKKAGTLRSAGLNNNVTTVIYIHGFTEHGLGLGSKTVRDAYLTRNETYNVILVDWGDLSVSPWYVQAAKNTRPTAVSLAKFLKFYHDTDELPLSSLHIIGFSLGAHVAGFVGKHLQKYQKIPRITGLDPAFPLFPLKDPTQRLTKTDADYVDIIHTDSGVLGLPVSCGHADFYPNCETFLQPGCEPSKLAERNTFDQIGTCNHMRAWRFYSESVKNPKAFPATKCEKHAGPGDSHKVCPFSHDGYMGFPASLSTTTGNFYLTTNDHKPYGRGVREQPQVDRSKFITKFFNP